MAKIIHNGVEYGGSGYSKNEIDRKLGLKLNKSSIDTEISEDSSNPVQNRVIAKAFKESQAIINVEELPITNIKNTFYRYGYKGESQYIDVDALSEPNLERFDIVKQRFENAGFTVELKPDSSVHPKYTVTYPSEIYAYITPTVGYLIPTRIELVDVTNTQDQHEPELVVYYMQGTSETYTLRRANSSSVGSIFEYAEPASPSLYAGNEEEQTVTKLDDGQSFIGTKAEWEALSQQEKNKYDGKIVNITDDTNTNGEFVDITSQCTVVLGTAKVMKCGQIVMINGYVPKVTGSNGFKTIVTGVPAPISNGTTNSAYGSVAISGGNSGQVFAVKVNDSIVTAYCSISYTQEYSVMYLTDE